MKTYKKGAKISIATNRPAILFGKRYARGDEVTIRLSRGWTPQEELGGEGPWGWNKYTSEFVESLGQIEKKEEA